MTGHHWVTMLDILGFRDMVETRPLSLLVDQVALLIAVAEPKEASCGFPSKLGRMRQRDLTLGHLHFSDTLMLWTPPIDARDSDFNVFALSHLCITVGNLIAFALVNGLPLRGGLAFGECYIDPAKQLAIGQPIVDAHLLEQDQEWLGAAVSFDQLRKLREVELIGEWCGIFPYPVPTKTVHSCELFALDWTRIPRMPPKVTQSLWKINARSAIEQALSEGLKNARSAVERALSKGISAEQQESVYRKWQNAAEFFRMQRQRQPLTFFGYRGPNEGWETVADEPV